MNRIFHQDADDVGTADDRTTFAKTTFAKTTFAKTILYFDHTSRMGGGEIALLNLVSALDTRRYYPIVVLASNGPLVAKLKSAGIETHVLRLDAAVLETRKDSLGPGSLLRVKQVWACTCYLFRLVRLARYLNADLIHTNSLKSDLIGGIAGRLAGIPVIWHVRDNIDSQYLPAQVASAFRLLSHLIPQVIVANSESTLRTLCAPPRQTTVTIYSGVTERSFDHLAASNETASSPFGRRLKVVHDGYDTTLFQSVFSEADQYLTVPSAVSSAVSSVAAGPEEGDPEEGGRAATSNVVLVGRIASWKGQHIFIEAAASLCDRFPEACFQIVGAPLFGEYDYEQSLYQMAQDLGVADRVKFLGFREDIPDILAAADIVVHASTLGEPFGQVVIEGMAAGKPVIATLGGALPEIVLPGVTGLLVPREDAPAMARAIASLLGDPARAAAMGRAGQQRVQEKFTIAHTVRKVAQVYDFMLNNQPEH